ncbi:unnamed protein product [Effrenium voratum]|nr:unnamed protein product [Effrenium voratum]
MAAWGELFEAAAGAAVPVDQFAEEYGSAPPRVERENSPRANSEMQARVISELVAAVDRLTRRLGKVEEALSAAGIEVEESEEEDEDAGSALTYGDAPDAPSGSPGASFGDALAAAKADRRRRPRKR